jgi:hypothetical protein
MTESGRRYVQGDTGEGVLTRLLDGPARLHAVGSHCGDVTRDMARSIRTYYLCFKKIRCLDFI